MGPVPRRISIPRPHKAFGLCALGFTQFKADGLVQTYGLPTRNHDLATRNHSYDLATSNHSYDLATSNHSYDLATSNHSYGLATHNHSYDLATSTHTPTTTQPATILLSTLFLRKTNFTLWLYWHSIEAIG